MSLSFFNTRAKGNHRIRTKLRPFLLHLLWALIFAATAVQLFTAFYAPSALSIDLGTPGDTAYIANFFRGERNGDSTFRWSTSGSRLLLPDVSGGPIALDLYMHGDDRTSSGDLSMQFERDGQSIASFAMLSGWRVYRVLLPEDSMSSVSKQTSPLDLVLSEYRSVPGDRNLLGVPIDWLQIEALTSLTAPRSGPLWLTLRLIWGLGVLAGGLWLLDHWVFASSRVIATHLRVGGLATVVAVSLTLWARRDPYALARMLPLSLWVLLMFSLLVALAGLWMWRGNAMRLVATSSPLPVIATFVILLHILLLPPLPVAIRGTAAVLILMLPGALLAWLLFDDERDLLTRAFLGVCGGVALLSLIMLALHAIPGPLPWWALLFVTDALSLWFGWRLKKGYGLWVMDSQPRTADDGPPRTRRLTIDRAPIPNLQSPILVLGVLLAAVFRLTFLGSAEFQGDEGRALLMATGVLHGHDEILLLHKKGPVEVLLPAGPLVLTGHINEWAARLPFALAGLGTVLGSAVLARHLFHGDEDLPISGVSVGLVAAVILALDGFMIAFSRIVQYQSILMLMTIGAVWCCWRFYQGVQPYQRYLVCAAALMAVALLAHYDSIFGFPALAWLVLAGGWRRRWHLAQWLKGLAPALLVGASLLASFYVPFALHERFGRTWEYVVGRTGQNSTAVALFNNLINYYRLATFYSTTFQMHWIAIALAVGFVIWLWWYVRPRWLGSGLAAVLLVGCAMMIAAPERFELVQGGNWSIVVFALPIVGIALAPATPAPLRVLVLWFGTAFVAQAFLIANPRTHFYTMHTAAALLAALAVVWLMQWLAAQRLRWLCVALAGSGVGVLLLAAPYMYIVFIRQVPEYRTVFPAARPALYQASYGDQRPKGGYFGFPGRAGWKVIGDLYRQGILHGDYESNEKDLITGWYTQGTFRCRYEPDYYFAAWSVASSTIAIRVPPDYHLLGSVLSDNVKGMDIYSREPVTQMPQIFTLDDYRQRFDAQPIPNFPMQRALVEVVPQHRLDARWQDHVLLRGYDLDRQALRPGQTATLSLYWAASDRVDAGYAPIVEIVDRSGTVVGQAEPYCTVPPTDWNIEYLSGVAFALPADAQMSPGTYTLRVGLRHTQSGAWLPLADGGETLRFATLMVVEP